MAELIQKQDTLNEGRVKLNNAITDAEKAKADAGSAVSTSNQAKQIAQTAEDKADSVQTQFNQVVIEGDSSVEAAQARVDEKGESHDTLKARIDNGFTSVTSQLADVVNVQNYELNSKDRRKKGITVFTTDDSRAEDYTIGKAIFESVGVPAVVYAVSNSIGKSGYLSIEQALELQNDLGWEIASHSKTHPAPFPNISDAQAEIEFRESKLELESMGFNIYNYSYVGGNYGGRERLLARKYYRSARCSDRQNKGVNEPPLNTYELKTIWIDPETAPLKQWLEEYNKTTALQKMYDFAVETINHARSTNGVAIISTHFINVQDADLQNTFRSVVEYANSQTEVTTLNDALNRVGNIVDIGDYSQYGERSKNKSHVVIGVDGVMSGSLSVTERDRYSVSTPFDMFPFGVTITPISYANREGTPEDYSGFLKTHRFDDMEGSVNYQVYMSFRSKAEYIRYVGEGNVFGDWELYTGIMRDEVYTPLSKPSEFPSGVNVVRVTSNSVGLNETPTGRRGKIVNIKPEKSGESISYNEQKYYEIETRDTYTRYANSDNTWSGWVKDNYVKLPGYNIYSISTPINDFPLGVTYSIVTSNNPDIALTPNQRRGTLVTHKLTTTSSLAYSYQEYLSDNGDSFRRHPSGATTWGDWYNIRQ